jgi:hypothetical protein
LPFRKQWEDSDVTLASTQETLLIKKVNSILIQAATSFKTTTQREAKKGKNRKEENWLLMDP